MIIEDMYGNTRSKRKVAVLTYPVKHRKTFDVLCLLKANGYCDVAIYAVPLHYQKKRYPLIQHRPELHYEIPDISELCKNFGYRYEIGKIEDFEIEEDRVVLIAGAGIVPEQFVASHTVINAHPGYIPNCRELDAFKWAIIEDEPVGVTTHLLGEYVDAGKIIERRTIEVYSTDSFHALAQRVYENEVSMLVEAIWKYDSLKSIEMIYPDGFVLHKRMPEETERFIMEAFEQYKEKHGTSLMNSRRTEPHAIMDGVPAKQIDKVSASGQVLQDSLIYPDCGRRYILNDNQLTMGGAPPLSDCRLPSALLRFPWQRRSAA